MKNPWSKIDGRNQNISNFFVNNHPEWCTSLSSYFHISGFLCGLLQDGKIDFSYFAPDCFHFTIKGHEELAKGLWNNMVNFIPSAITAFIPQHETGQKVLSNTL